MAIPQDSDPPGIRRDEDRHLVFFEGQYSYRKWVVCLVVLVLFATGTWIFVIGGWQLVTGQFAGNVSPGLLAVVAWLAIAWLPSVYVGWRILFRPGTAVRIDNFGITLGSRHWDWDHIEYVGGRQTRKWPKPVIALVFHRRSRWPLKADYGIPVEISEEEYDAFMDRLADFVESAFPHVTVG
jgi:hypothetical protein